MRNISHTEEQQFQVCNDVASSLHRWLVQTYVPPVNKLINIRLKPKISTMCYVIIYRGQT